MAKSCETCGCVMPSEVKFGPLVGRDAPFEVYHDGRIVPFTKAEAMVMFELVRFGRVSRDRMFELSPRAAEGITEQVIAVRLANMRRKLKDAGVPVIIASIRNYGYQLAHQ